VWTRPNLRLNKVNNGFAAELEMVLDEQGNYLKAKERRSLSFIPFIETEGKR
jgi:hypothetical protein